jgi:hypothetical protein
MKWFAGCDQTKIVFLLNQKPLTAENAKNAQRTQSIMLAF